MAMITTTTASMVTATIMITTTIITTTVAPDTIAAPSDPWRNGRPRIARENNVRRRAAPADIYRRAHAIARGQRFRPALCRLAFCRLAFCRLAQFVITYNQFAGLGHQAGNEHAAIEAAQDRRRRGDRHPYPCRRAL